MLREHHFEASLAMSASGVGSKKLYFAALHGMVPPPVSAVGRPRYCLNVVFDTTFRVHMAFMFQVLLTTEQWTVSAVSDHDTEERDLTY